MSKTYRVLIGDDHKHARQAMRLILANDERFEIVGEATNGKEVIHLVEKCSPDLVLMDINMPILDGLHATGIIKERFPNVKIVIVTVSDDASDLFEALKRGAQGYLLKNLHPDYWLKYLHSVLTDEVTIPRAIANRMLKEFHQTSEETQPNESLTSREQEVLALVAKGWSNKEIASHLVISEYTVKNHLKNIMQKLHLRNRVQLTRYAYEKGWVK